MALGRDRDRHKYTVNLVTGFVPRHGAGGFLLRNRRSSGHFDPALIGQTVGVLLIHIFAGSIRGNPALVQLANIQAIAFAILRSVGGHNRVLSFGRIHIVGMLLRLSTIADGRARAI